MSIIQAIIYGIVQGIGEFLPISSSAHLIAIPQIFGWQDPGLAFDVALHLGTLAAVIAFFWKDWTKLIYSGIMNPKSKDGKLFWFIVIASIPGAVVGKLFEKQAESAFRNLALIGTMLIIIGIILYIADKRYDGEVAVENIGFKRSFFIGLSQALAIIPGVSRSGITMTTGLFSGLSKEGAARFSFLLSTPIILGAGLLKLKDLIHTPISSMPSFAIGVLVSAVVGFLSIKFLLNYLKNKGFGIFVVYRIVVGFTFIAIYLLRK
ncbi:undecaprenyl-diphosphatase UppP [Clostridium ljungdahlii]|uniref:Undecaprenyl-diphosphatase n=1 Tax=Clostridium ljungdahlii (strain ATCC 55383 / DSM 13528 / PETC) TaxID=748727 RepID=D8GTK7_CLOLD|nr:undecaprenyl-diphosphatase UppP [Clostridium ljungdahlii]ADK14656.1 undecaprenyl-diphosphatase [Clostridium ljungdahlii DSM 13528]OAA85894.1 Undecaprenyl-diphosphatase [Clostridium ljungdahlii DSM 13528]